MLPEGQQAIDRIGEFVQEHTVWSNRGRTSNVEDIKNDRQEVSAIIVAAGESQRMGGVDKVFTMIGGEPILAQVIDTF